MLFESHARRISRSCQVLSAAAAIFRATPYAYLADDDPVTAEVDLAQEHVWLVVDPAD